MIFVIIGIELHYCLLKDWGIKDCFICGIKIPRNGNSVPREAHLRGWVL